MMYSELILGRSNCAICSLPFRFRFIEYSYISLAINLGGGDSFSPRNSFFLLANLPSRALVTDLQQERLLQHNAHDEINSYRLYCPLFALYTEGSISYLVGAYKFTITGPNSRPRRLVWLIIRADTIITTFLLRKSCEDNIKIYIEL